jgi:peptide chain release factor 2
MNWVFHFDVKGAKIKIEELERLVSAEEFWSQNENSSKVLKELKNYKDVVQNYEDTCREYEDLVLLIEMAIDEADEEMATEIGGSIDQFIQDFEKLRIATLLSGEYDKNNAIISMHAGAGGTEACDWVSMLFRMYSKYVDKKGYKMEVLDFLDGEEAGIKSVTFQVTGENAYGYLKSEKGVHRLVRISPFDSSGRRHTSFASCDVLPELDDDIDIQIEEEEIRVDTYRASGAGGQHINKTDSAIRITHIPTGIVVQCQNERSQHKNKATAIKLLKTKLFDIKRKEQMAKMNDIRGEVKEIGWGSQIRSYVMHPYSLVKDHRTNEEKGSVQAVMDGDIDAFINAYLQWITSK